MMCQGASGAAIVSPQSAEQGAGQGMVQDGAAGDASSGKPPAPPDVFIFVPCRPRIPPIIYQTLMNTYRSTSAEREPGRRSGLLAPVA
jgi:hypothetical protein